MPYKHKEAYLTQQEKSQALCGRAAHPRYRRRNPIEVGMQCTSFVKWVGEVLTNLKDTKYETSISASSAGLTTMIMPLPLLWLLADVIRVSLIQRHRAMVVLRMQSRIALSSSVEMLGPGTTSPAPVSMLLSWGWARSVHRDLKLWMARFWSVLVSRYCKLVRSANSRHVEGLGKYIDIHDSPIARLLY